MIMSLTNVLGPRGAVRSIMTDGELPSPMSGVLPCGPKHLAPQRVFDEILECVVGTLTWLPIRLFIQIGLAIAEHDSQEDLSNDASSHRSEFRRVDVDILVNGKLYRFFKIAGFREDISP